MLDAVIGAEALFDMKLKELFENNVLRLPSRSFSHRGAKPDGWADSPPCSIVSALQHFSNGSRVWMHVLPAMQQVCSLIVLYVVAPRIA